MTELKSLLNSLESDIESIDLEKKRQYKDMTDMVAMMNIYAKQQQLKAGQQKFTVKAPRRLARRFNEGEILVANQEPRIIMKAQKRQNN